MTVIDQTIDPELVELVAHELNSNPDDITKAMVQLSLDTATLPNHTRETINQYLHAWLETHRNRNNWPRRKPSMRTTARFRSCL